MAGIYENLDTIEQIKIELKTALEDKGVDMVGATFSEYPQKIQSITPKIRLADYGSKLSYGTFTEVPSWVDFDGSTDFSYMFYDCKNLQSVTLSGITIIDANQMFLGCSNLQNVNIDYSTIEDAGYMFSGCDALASLDNANFTNATHFSMLFQNCINLTSCDVTGGENTTDAVSMFDGCKKIEVLGNFDLPNLTKLNNMFRRCSILRKIGYITVGNVTSSSNLRLFGGAMNKLTEFGGLIDLKISLNDYNVFPNAPNLDYQSCINVLNGLYDFVLNGETPTSSQGKLKVHQNFLTTVGDEISIGTNKGWTITA